MSDLEAAEAVEALQTHNPDLLIQTLDKRWDVQTDEDGQFIIYTGLFNK